MSIENELAHNLKSASFWKTFDFTSGRTHRTEIHENWHVFSVDFIQHHVMWLDISVILTQISGDSLPQISIKQKRFYYLILK